MKYPKIIGFVLSALVFTFQVNAETIDGAGSNFGSPGAVGTQAKVCVKIVFIKRNSGTLITGLTTAKIKPFRAVETSFNPVTGTEVTKNFPFTFSLAASAAPVQAGLYDFCLTPKGVGVVWQAPPNLQHHYVIESVVLGTVAADNGVFIVQLN